MFVSIVAGLLVDMIVGQCVDVCRRFLSAYGSLYLRVRGSVCIRVP